MGTNYYVVPNRPSIAKSIHLGKSSYGWLFDFHDYEDKWHDPPIAWHTYKQVVEWLERYVRKEKLFVILDEYDEEVSLESFIGMVQSKQNNEQCQRNPENFAYSRNVDGYRFTEGDFC